MDKENKSVWPAALLIIGCLIIASFAIAGTITSTIKNNKASVDLTGIATTNDLNIVKTSLENKINELSIENQRLNNATDVILEKEDEETKALTIADDYLNSRDFKKVLVEFLNDNSLENQSVESYKDIESIVIKESEISYHDKTDSAEVEYVLRVTYFNDSDDDEEDAETAKVKVTLDLEELDEDENFEDFETTESNFVLVKVY